MPGAAIDAQPITLQSQAGGLTPNEATATSGSDGKFVIYMDPGTYNVDVQPPDSAGLPTACIKTYQVSNDQDGVELTISDPQGLRGHVIVTGMQGQSQLASAQVNVYQQVPDTLSTQRADLQARSVTDGAGSFLLLLPTP